MEIPAADMTNTSEEALNEHKTVGHQDSKDDKMCDKSSLDMKQGTLLSADEQEMVLQSKENSDAQKISPDCTVANSKPDGANDVQLSNEASENHDDKQNSDQTREAIIDKLDSDSNSKVTYMSDATESQEITCMEYRTAGKTITVDDSSDTEDDSEDSSDADCNQDAVKTINRTITSDRDVSPERKVKLNRHGFEDMRTKGELMPEELPPLEELTITVDETVEMVEVGTVSSIVGVLVIVQSGDNVPPLNDDTILFVEGHKVLGQVFEVFGPVKTPWYSIRFNDAGNIETKGIKPGTKVYCAPKEDSFTKFVFVDSIKRIKGSDASWENNNEPPEKYLEFSDDEEEKRAKAKRKNKKKTGENNEDDASDSTVRQKKNKTSSQCWPPKDDLNPRENSLQGQGRGHNPFRGRPYRGNSGLTGNFSQRHCRPRMNHPQQEHNRYPASNHSGRGMPPRFGGPPNFQSQQFGIRKPFLGSNQSLFNGNEGHSDIDAPKFFRHNQEPVPMKHIFQTPQMNDPPPQRIGPPPQINGPPPLMNGQSPHMNGPPLRINGPPPQMNGPPPRMNGPPLRMDSQSSQIRGPTPQMNGPPPQMNGPPSRTNGPPPQMNGQPPQMNVQYPNSQQMFQGPPPQLHTAPSNFNGGNDNTVFRPSISNSVGQTRPNQFRVHTLNPVRPSSQNELSQSSVPANKQFDQVNLTNIVPAPYRPNTNFMASTSEPPQRGQIQKPNNFTLTGNIDQHANCGLVIGEPHQINGSNSGCQGQNMGMRCTDNRTALQGQNMGQNNMVLNTNNQYSSNSHGNMEQLQMGKMNEIGNQIQRFGQKERYQSGQISFTSTEPGNHGYHPQAYDINKTFEVCPNGNSGGLSRFQAPQALGGMYDLGINYKNLKNMQNSNVQAGHIMDQRFVQGN